MAGMEGMVVFHFDLRLIVKEINVPCELSSIRGTN